MKKIIGLLFLLISLPAAFIVGCDSKTTYPPMNTATPTPNTTGTATNTATATATRTATNTSTVTATRTATNTATKTETSTTTSTATNTATTTATATAQARPAMVVLGSAINYAALSYAHITNTGATTLCGNIGEYPGSQVDGGIVLVCSGISEIATGAANIALQTDLGAAYTDAQGRPNPAALPSELGGLTLYEGVYTYAGTLSISSDLYLDAKGDPNSVFIFQVKASAGYNLVVGPGVQVHLINGALASNVFWAVSGYCSLDTTAKMVGNVMAGSQVTFNTGATLEGKAFAQTADITFQSNQITYP